MNTEVSQTLIANTMHYPVETFDGELVFAVDPRMPETVKSMCENSDLREIVKYADGSMLLYGSPAQFEKFWTAWTLMTQ